MSDLTPPPFSKDVPAEEEESLRELERKVMRDQIAHVLEKWIWPCFGKLRQEIPPAEVPCLNLLESHLRELTRPGISQRFFRELTTKEIEICRLISKGLSSKEIAKEFKVSILTVNTHRNNIRQKLKIIGQKINLASYLQSFSQPF